MAGLLLTILVTYSTVSLFTPQTAACMKKEQPRPQPTVAPGQTTTADPRPKANCSSSDSYYERCLNEGVCEVLINKEDGSRKSYCVCKDGYTGDVCQQAPRPAPVTSATAALAGVSAIVFLVLLVGIVAAMRIWCNRRHGGEAESGPSSPHSLNGEPNAARPSLLQYNSPPSQNGGTGRLVHDEGESLVEETV